MQIRRNSWIAGLFLMTLAICATFTRAAVDVKPLEIGLPAPDFDLPGVDGKNHKLAEYKDAKVLVVVFTCNHCPTAQAYEQRIIDLHKGYHARGVALVAINPNDAKAVRLDELGYTDLSDSLEEMKIRAKERDFKFPYLYDGETQKVSHAYGAVATPHVFVFDDQRKLRYQGRIDDGKDGVAEPKTHDLRNAVDALLAGKAPPVETTKVFGCSTKWSDKREDAKRSIEKWDAEEVKISGIELDDVKKLAKNDGAKAPLRLVNVWASWCGPCVAEMPELTTMHRMYRKRAFELITISVDGDADASLAALKENHLSATNYVYGGDHDALVAALDAKEWAGPIPHTLLIAPGGKVVYRQNGPFDERELKRAIADNLGRTYASRTPVEKAR